MSRASLTSLVLVAAACSTEPGESDDTDATTGATATSSASTSETSTTTDDDGSTGAPEDGSSASSSVGSEETGVDASSTSADSTSGGLGECEFLPGDTSVPRVRIVYLVPSDRDVVDAYAATLERAARDLQLWFAEQTSDGSTFEVYDPVVEIVHTAHDAAWYSTHAEGEPYLWFWNNVLADAFPATGGGFDQPDNVWAYYIDADGACGQLAGAGTSGVAVLPANDLRGLVGEPNQPPCPADPPDENPRCRWVGGLGHELGHGFGLPHPTGCDAPDPETPCDDTALLWLGYISYPDAHLTEDDRAVLSASPFFAPRTLPQCAIDCSMP